MMTSVLTDIYTNGKQPFNLLDYPFFKLELDEIPDYIKFNSVVPCMFYKTNIKEFDCNKVFTNNVHELKFKMFSNCKYLQKFIASDNIDRVDGKAMEFCYNLSEVLNFRQDVKIEFMAFFDLTIAEYNCSLPKEYINDHNNFVIIGDEETHDGVVYGLVDINNRHNSNLRKYLTALKVRSLERNVTIPDEITLIKKEAIYDNDIIESIYIPESVNNIESGNFNFCKNLKYIYTPKGNKDRLTILVPRPTNNTPKYIIEEVDD